MLLRFLDHGCGSISRGEPGSIGLTAHQCGRLQRPGTGRHGHFANLIFDFEPTLTRKVENILRRNETAVALTLILTVACAGCVNSRETASRNAIARSGNGWSQRTAIWGPQTTPINLGDYQIIRYVSQSKGSDSGGDGSKEKPWASLGHALSQGRDAGPANRIAILVGAGTYRGSTLVMKSYVDLCGGFDPVAWKRDIWAFRSVLEGEGVRRVAVGADHARLDGFVLTGGKLRGKGGAMLCEGVSPVLSNNIFSENGTLTPAPWKPKQIHENANDGGAIACLSGGSPRIENNLFVRNTTETGRGGAVACHDKASPTILRNVFVDNEAGLKDAMRSSDGGAISVFDHSNPQIRDNVIADNQASGKNDGGGIFVALWSSPEIVGNLVVGNLCTDDAGGIFLGGQEHRYGVPLDPVPPMDKFLIQVEGNLIVGNANPNRNSGAMRVTMESRATLVNNIVARNSGGVYLQRSEIVLRNKTILDSVQFAEEKETVGPGNLVNNIFWGGLDLKATATVAHCDANQALAGTGNLNSDPLLTDDGRRQSVRAVAYDNQRFVTTLELLPDAALQTNELVGRPLRFGERWVVVKSNSDTNILVWGDLAKSALPALGEFEVPPTWRLRAGSPCLDRGTNEGAPSKDFEGDPRPLNGGNALTVDIGADEYSR